MVKKVKSVHLIKKKDVIVNQVAAFEGVKEASIDVDNNIIKGVCLFGTRESANDRTYEDKAIASLTRLAEGTKMFLNHPTKSEEKERGGCRDIRDWGGIFEGAYQKEDKIFADLHVRESYFDLVKDIALMQPQGTGCSINARVKVYTDDEGRENVADVDMLRSCDIVDNAATTSSLWESLTEKIEETQDPAIEILFDNKIDDLIDKSLAKEGILRDKIDEDELENEIRKVTWTAQDLIFEIFRDDDLSVEGKRNKINEVFDDLEIEIDKITNKMNEAIKENEMELTIEMVRADSGIMEAITKELSNKASTESMGNDLKEATDRIKDLETQVGAREADVAYVTEACKSLESDNAEQEKKLDEYQVKETLVEKAEKINKLIEASKISKEMVTEVFMKTLMGLEETGEGEDKVTIEDQVKEQIADRIASVTGKKPVIKNMGDTNDTDLDDNKDKDMSGKEVEEAVDEYFKG